MKYILLTAIALLSYHFIRGLVIAFKRTRRWEEHASRFSCPEDALEEYKSALRHLDRRIRNQVLYRHPYPGREFDEDLERATAAANRANELQGKEHGGAFRTAARVDLARLLTKKARYMDTLVADYRDASGRVTVSVQMLADEKGRKVLEFLDAEASRHLPDEER